MRIYQIDLWRNNDHYCKTYPDVDTCLYSVIIEAETDYLAREKAIRLYGLPKEVTDTPIIYSVKELVKQ